MHWRYVSLQTCRFVPAMKKKSLHYSVYVVLLEDRVGKYRKVRDENPQRDAEKPCVYVGMTGINPKERFKNHKAGYKASGYVKKYGIRLTEIITPKERIENLK